ncbi:MAG: GTP 3',8-cyclase MoaA [Deltaproteobacteria bacterium]|nr:GTP 3',8-cyclase MoaA [Deltaproteobacteria bacterium]
MRRRGDLRHARLHGRGQAGARAADPAGAGARGRRGPSVSPTPTRGTLADGWGRAVTYLRLSVTDRCNYRCTYCMPPEGLPDKLPHHSILTFEEAERIVGVLAASGVRRVRLTGGEPLARRGLEDLVRRLVRVPGVAQVVMTTNGHGLAGRLAALAAAGLGGVSVSLDSLDGARFRRVTRQGDLDEVRRGIAAATARFRGVRLNTVAIAGFNDDEVGAICRYAWDLGCVPRFIEHMPMSDGRLEIPGRFLTAAAVRARLLGDLAGTLTPDPGDGEGGGPARYWRHSGGGLVGFIAPLTEHFCDSCNRVRLDASGRLHACLYHSDAADLRAALAAGGATAVAAAARAVLSRKPPEHQFGPGTDGASPKHMGALGG